MSIVETTDTESLLTDRQHGVLRTAVLDGYFDVPRGSTLAELADTLAIDKATASTIIRRGEGTLVKWFLTGSGSKGRRVR